MLHMRRREAAVASGRPVPNDPITWLEHTEAFCGKAVPGGLQGLMERAAPVAPSRRTDWRAGRKLLSTASPRIELYPHFLSDAEAEHMLTLAYTHVQPAATAEEEGKARASGEGAAAERSREPADGPLSSEQAGGEVAGGEVAGGDEAEWSKQSRAVAFARHDGKSWARKRMLVSAPTDDPLTRLIEERCAEATGVPRHRNEAGLAMKHAAEMPKPAASSTPPTADASATDVSDSADGPEASAPRVMPSLHVDTNNQGTHRCATVIIYLNDVPAGCGGETRFPIANQPADSPLRASGRACLATGATALFRAEEAQAPHPDADAQALLDAAERSGIGVHVRPTKGAACVFWTMGKEGVDPSSWHNGAKVLYGGGGKWIAQKFKELPMKYRKALPLALPDELAPPPMP